MTEQELHNLELGQAGVDLVVGTTAGQNFYPPEGEEWGMVILPSRDLQTIWQCLYKGEVKCVMFTSSIGDNWKYLGAVDHVRIITTQTPVAPLFCHRNANA